MPARDYGIALAAWFSGAIATPFVLTGLLIAANIAVCGSDSTDCSWGFELLLVVPVLLWTFLVTGPRLIGRWVGDPTMVRRARIAAAASIVVLYGAAGNGSGPFTVALVVVLLAVPAVAVGRRPT